MNEPTIKLNGCFRDTMGHVWHLIGEFFGVRNDNGSFTIKVIDIGSGNGRSHTKEITLTEDNPYGRKHLGKM